MAGAGTAPKAVRETSPRCLREHMGHSRLAHVSPLTRGTMVATAVGAEVEGREYSSFGGSKDMGIPSHLFTCWFNPKPCTGVPHV